MKLRIDKVHGHGDESEERVLLTAIEDCNLNCYMVCDATYSDGGKISNKNRHSKWFVTKEVKKGDRIALHTKVGERKSISKDGTTWHHEYWQFKSPIWNDDGDAAVLIEISNWVTTKAK